MAPTRADAGWDEVLFVCAECRARRDGEALPLRKWLRRELKAAGLKKRLRVVECGCLDLCPKRGVTLARGGELCGPGKKLRVLREGEDPRRVLDWLLETGAADGAG